MKSIFDVKYGVESSQVLDIYIPDKNKYPVFVYFHGGGLERGDKKQNFISDLVAKGVAVVSANYRMYPNAVYPEYIEDAASVVTWVKENIGKYGEINGLFVGGSSAGG